MSENKQAAQAEWIGQEVALSKLREDRDLQPREVPLMEKVAAKYARDMLKGDTFPPILVAQINRSLFTVDGHHRVAAAQRAGRETIAAQVKRMTLDEARRFAKTTNNGHGASYNNADKKRIVLQLIKHGEHLRPDGTTKSPRRIEKELNKVVSYSTVRKYMREVGVEPGDEFDDDIVVKPWSYENENIEASEPELITQPEIVARTKVILEELTLLCDQLEDPASAQQVLRQLDATASAIAPRLGLLDI